MKKKQHLQREDMNEAMREKLLKKESDLVGDCLPAFEYRVECVAPQTHRPPPLSACVSCP